MAAIRITTLRWAPPFAHGLVRDLRHTDLVAQVPEVEAYRLRCEARPAFRKSLDDQMATFAAAAG